VREPAPPVFRPSSYLPMLRLSTRNSAGNTDPSSSEGHNKGPAAGSRPGPDNSHTHTDSRKLPSRPRSQARTHLTRGQPPLPCRSRRPRDDAAPGRRAAPRSVRPPRSSRQPPPVRAHCTSSNKSLPLSSPVTPQTSVSEVFKTDIPGPPGCEHDYPSLWVGATNALLDRPSAVASRDFRDRARDRRSDQCRREMFLARAQCLGTAPICMQSAGNLRRN